MKKLIYILFGLCLFSSCQDDENKAYVPEKVDLSTDEIDVYFQENFQDKYRCAIRWKWVDRYVDISYIVAPRSEEHTSELQSRQYLVCRLLLEKKKLISLIDIIIIVISIQ